MTCYGSLAGRPNLVQLVNVRPSAHVATWHPKRALESNRNLGPAGLAVPTPPHIYGTTRPIFRTRITTCYARVEAGPYFVPGLTHARRVWQVNGIEVTGVTLRDSPFWCLHPVQSQNIHVHHMKIRSRMCAAGRLDLPRGFLLSSRGAHAQCLMWATAVRV